MSKNLLMKTPHGQALKLGMQIGRKAVHMTAQAKAAYNKAWTDWTASAVHKKGVQKVRAQQYGAFSGKK